MLRAASGELVGATPQPSRLLGRDGRSTAGNIMDLGSEGVDAEPPQRRLDERGVVPVPMEKEDGAVGLTGVIANQSWVFA